MINHKQFCQAQHYSLTHTIQTSKIVIHEVVINSISYNHKVQ